MMTKVPLMMMTTKMKVPLMKTMKLLALRMKICLMMLKTLCLMKRNQARRARFVCFHTSNHINKTEHEAGRWEGMQWRRFMTAMLFTLVYKERKVQHLLEKGLTKNKNSY